MSKPDIDADLRQFIFEYVDSVGQLDLLLFMREQPAVYFNSETLSRELRTSASSAASCLTHLHRSRLLKENAKSEFCYAPARAELDELIAKLATVYKIKPHKILELIFSSAKRARSFADAFSLIKPSKPGDENG